MKKYLILVFLCFNACALKDTQNIANLKTQTLMFSQKKKIQNKEENAIITISYLNPVLDYKTSEDIFALSLTPKHFALEKLEVFVNLKQAQIKTLNEKDELLKYLLQNQYTEYFQINSPANKEENTLVVRICPNPNPCFELNFQKYPKSLYYRSVDVDTQYN